MRRLLHRLAAAVVAVGVGVLPVAPSSAAATGADHWNSDRQFAGRDGFNSAETTITTDNAARLRQKWRLRPASNGRYSATVADGVVYVPLQKELRAVAAATGATRWARKFPQATLVTTPVVSGSLVYVGVTGEGLDREDSLYALDRATGRTVWRHNESRLTGRSANIYHAGVLGGGRL